MARRSDPSLANAPADDRFFVWDDINDQYLHDQLAENWDRLDAIIGRPLNDVAWPPTQGLAGGIFAQINLLMQSRSPIGEVYDWWFPFTGTETQTQIEALVAQHAPGSAICDGRLVGTGAAVFPAAGWAPATHDFASPAPAAFYTPNLVNSFILGASTAKTPGTAAPDNSATTEASANGTSFAPGVARSINADRKIGVGGTNMKPTVTMRDHTHTHNHVHMYGGLNQDTDGNGDVIALSDGYNASASVFARAASGLDWSVTSQTGSVKFRTGIPLSDPANIVVADALTMISNARTEFLVALKKHRHSLVRASSSVPKGSQHPDRYNVSTGQAPEIPGGSTTLSNSLATSTQTLTTGSATENIDRRPQHMGMIKLMRVKYPSLVNNTQIIPT